MSDLPLEQPYSPQLVEAELRKAGLPRAIGRVLRIVGVLLIGLLWRFIDRRSWAYRNGETVEDRQRRRAKWLLDRIVRLGPTFVKVGQSLATRPDLMPLPYIHVLSKLHDQLPAFPNEVAFAVIEEDLGWRPETLFRHFAPDPFAAASLGQVYRAVTYNGDEVAVKVQRPDLMRLISLDLALVRRLATWAERSPWLGRGQLWVSLVDEFGSKLFEELDYIHEAHLTARFRANLTGLSHIYAPHVHWDYTSRRVLTTEFVPGIKITDKEALIAAGIDIPALLGHGVRANLKQLFEDGLFHADPHPGNLLVRPEDGTLVFIDFGMMGVIQPAQKERLIEIFVDALNRSSDKLRENLIALGCLRPDARWDEMLPLADQMLRAIFGDQDRQHTFQEVASSFAALAYKYEFRIPADFAYIVRAIMTLEGISRQLDPGFDLFAVSAPYAVRMMLTFPNPSLRQRLMGELLTPDGRLHWTRLEQLAALASRDNGFRLEAEGLLEPVLDLLLSQEGSALRRAIVSELQSSASYSENRLRGIASLLSADPTMSGRAILDRIVAFLLSPKGAETRAQLLAGLRPCGDGRVDLKRASAFAAVAGRLHPDFRPLNLLNSLAGYLFSPRGKPARSELVKAGGKWLLEDVLGRIGLATTPAILAHD
jgi:predicted unusual protein kinase regulating ubiquinone biosynthesis (AarF/ABC1/UbiB family)